MYAAGLPTCDTLVVVVVVVVVVDIKQRSQMLYVLCCCIVIVSFVRNIPISLPSFVKVSNKDISINQLVPVVSGS
jgi:hypothetical protein